VRLVGEVGALLEMHGHPVRGFADVMRLREALFGYLNVDRGEPVEQAPAKAGEKGAVS